MQNVQLAIELYGAIFCLMLGMVLVWQGKKRTLNGHFLTIALFLNTLVLVADMITIIYQGDPTSMGGAIVVVSNFALYLLQYLQVLALAHYIRATLIEQGIDDGHHWIWIVYVLLGIAVIGLICTPFTGWYYTINEAHVYKRGRLFIFSMPLGGIALLIGVWKSFHERKRLENYVYLSLASIFALPILGLIIQMRAYGISFMNLGTTVSAMILFFTYEYRSRKMREEQEQMLALSRAYLLNSQIKPHFLFNSLAVIQALIDEDTDTAREAIGHLSQFLRKGLNLKVSENTIPLKEEIDYVKDYMYLEQLRFGDKVNILYDIPDHLSMRLPFLSIQPLVENAVRHGLRKKMEGGTIIVRARETEDGYTISVIDDGAGFDVEEARARALKGETSGNGVGVHNVEERIHLMCNGTMTMESTPGVGTTVVLRIPKAPKVPKKKEK